MHQWCTRLKLSRAAGSLGALCALQQSTLVMGGAPKRNENCKKDVKLHLGRVFVNVDSAKLCNEPLLDSYNTIISICAQKS